MFNIKNRIINEALYILKNNATLRETAKEFNLGKSTIHKDMSIRLKNIDLNLYEKIKEIMDNHLRLRHIKGGEVTKKRYQSLGT
ncbi:MAG: stage III sporulation protein D [Mollicutes bacterium]|nr:stage III sporulation protein D [Mollicutes bacterium]